MTSQRWILSLEILILFTISKIDLTYSQRFFFFDQTNKGTLLPNRIKSQNILNTIWPTIKSLSVTIKKFFKINKAVCCHIFFSWSLLKESKEHSKNYLVKIIAVILNFCALEISNDKYDNSTQNSINYAKLTQSIKMAIRRLIYVYLSTHAHIHTHKCTRTHMDPCTRSRAHTYIHILIQTHMHVRARIYLHTPPSNVHVHAHIYIYSYKYTHL